MSEPVTFEQLAAADGVPLTELPPPPPGPAELWPWGSGTEDDPYYTPDDYVFGTPIDEYLAAHPEAEK